MIKLKIKKKKILKKLKKRLIKMKKLLQVLLVLMFIQKGKIQEKFVDQSQNLDVNIVQNILNLKVLVNKRRKRCQKQNLFLLKLLKKVNLQVKSL